MVLSPDITSRSRCNINKVLKYPEHQTIINIIMYVTIHIENKKSLSKRAWIYQKVDFHHDEVDEIEKVKVSGSRKRSLKQGMTTGLDFAWWKSCKRDHIDRL